MNVVALPWAIDHMRKGIARERERKEIQHDSLKRIVLKERVNHDIALSSERDEVDRKKRHAADTTHFLFDSIHSLEKTVLETSSRIGLLRFSWISLDRFRE
jgi:hypothetical protein